ncbi:MAG: DUF1080 domain-containing protein, partial [Lentisphaeraceae bacterium]|nr:DUF1080 domain-containing protein [Lentisphaeraceae bacterium]
KEHSGFKYQGEYKKGSIAVQATVLKDGKFLVATYRGGLPGAGWDKTAIKSEVLSEGELQERVSDFTKVERVSPTMGKPAPANALLSMPSGFSNVKNGILHAGGKTKKDVGSFKMHVEFMLPFKPARNPSNQDRGNSGVYIYNNYEIQVIDSFALDFDSKNNAIKLESINKQWCGCFYKLKLADVNMALPALVWQTYDIDFTAPVIENGTKIKNGRITVLHNGVKIHDDFELLTGTGAGARRKQLGRGPIYFQNHGNPTVFRNVWIVEK